jgi:hypothetical protein
LIGQPPWTALGSRERADHLADGLVLLIVLLVLVSGPHTVVGFFCRERA